MIYLGEKAEDMQSARKMAKDAICGGTAFEKLCEMVEAQGGDVSYLRDTGKFELGRVQKAVLSPESGYVVRAHAEQIGRASVLLGAGRETAESAVDYGAGIVLHKNKGDFVQTGEPLATLYTCLLYTSRCV